VLASEVQVVKDVFEKGFLILPFGNDLYYVPLVRPRDKTDAKSLLSFAFC
jgi:hypothetical protein